MVLKTSCEEFTRSRRSRPGLKCRLYLLGILTDSPVFGLRPVRSLRLIIENPPNPLISIRSPFATVAAKCSIMQFMASSISCLGKCGCLPVIRAISSDFTICVFVARKMAHDTKPLDSLRDSRVFSLKNGWLDFKRPSDLNNRKCAFMFFCKYCNI